MNTLWMIPKFQTLRKGNIFFFNFSGPKNLQKTFIFRGRNKDKESGVVRGIDFQFVSNIINFDFPKSINSYIHRAGRTARGNNEGTALSFVSIKERPIFEEVENHLKSCFDDSSDQPIIR